MSDQGRRVGTDEDRSRRAAAHAGGRARCRGAAGLIVVLSLAVAFGLGLEAAGAPAPGPGDTARTVSSHDRTKSTRRSGPGAGATSSARLRSPRALIPADDWTFRPTVVVRRGGSQGSGTIIASVDDQTLVLTAAHVIRDTGPISIELHRYNLGVERSRGLPGPWPQPIGARLAAADVAADLAILRIEGLEPLPYVARLAPARRDPAIDSLVTSIGIDLGTRLSSWSSRLVEVLWFELNDSRDERLFFLTARTPEHGRSGGGLFLPDGDLVGVCVGHAELVRGRRLGVFASRESIYQLLLEHGLDAVVARSELRLARLARREPAPRTGRVGAGAASAPASATATAAASH
jgi:S1-C subfamily serine protease